MVCINNLEEKTLFSVVLEIGLFFESVCTLQKRFGESLRWSSLLC